ncbi:MAG: hypothetical protein P9M00_10065 [Candidatus Tritonobacter lacicola]|nr:hypothetical protein [Candidatus Tritonobacter lacicola]
MKKSMSVMLVLAGILSFVWAAAYGADKATDDMHNALGCGYDLASKKEVEKAADAFARAGKYAEKAKNWDGCIQAGYGLANAKRFKDGAALFNKASAIASTEKDWRGLVAAGYALASLPKDEGKIDEAKKSFHAVIPVALEKKNPRGIIEGGKGLAAAGDKAAAQKAFDEAFKMVKEAKSVDGSRTLMGCYESIGNKDKASMCKDMVREFRRHRAELSKKVEIPPPGWAAAGETIAGPKEYSAALQAARRGSADADIAAKAEWTLQNERLEAEQRIAAEQYNYLYSYPYQYDWIDPSWGSSWWGAAGYGGGPYFYGSYGNWGPNYYSHWGGYYGRSYNYRGGRWCYNY